MAVTVLIVDDVEELRESIALALRVRGGFEVIGEAPDGATALSLAEECRPDVIILDLGLPDLAGQDLVARLHSVAPFSQVVVYTGSVTPERAGVLSGVLAFVEKVHDIGYLVDLLEDLERTQHFRSSIQIGPDREDVGLARQFAENFCRRWGAAEAVEDAKLVVSELVTNALRHAGTSCELRLRYGRGSLRFEVVDRGGGLPDVRPRDDTSERGRGLLLVSALCISWGVDPVDGPGKVVWAELPVYRERTVGPYDDAAAAGGPQADPSSGPPASGEGSGDEDDHPRWETRRGPHRFVARTVGAPCARRATANRAMSSERLAASSASSQSQA